MASALEARVDALVLEMVGDGAVSAVSALIGDGRRPLVEARAGHRGKAPSPRPGLHDRFDLASLTKPWTATLALALDQKGELALDCRVGDIWPSAPPALARQTLAALLSHRSGLQGWRPLYRDLRSPARLVPRLLEASLLGAVKPTYSDLGFMLWAASAERACGASLMDLLRRHVLAPLGLSTVEVEPDPSRSVETRLSNAREVELAAALGVRVGARPAPAAGVPQDGNARFLHGLPGHAGLFAPARALWRLGAEWLEPRRLLDPAQVSRALAGRGRYALGWWRPLAAPAATRPLADGSFGHHGFTGGSLWVDPGHERVAVLLAHRTTVGLDLDPYRERFHRLAVG